MRISPGPEVETRGVGRPRIATSVTDERDGLSVSSLGRGGGQKPKVRQMQPKSRNMRFTSSATCHCRLMNIECGLNPSNTNKTPILPRPPLAIHPRHARPLEAEASARGAKGEEVGRQGIEIAAPRATYDQQPVLDTVLVSRTVRFASSSAASGCRCLCRRVQALHSNSSLGARPSNKCTGASRHPATGDGQQEPPPCAI